MVFMTELATDATANNVTIVLYSGNVSALGPSYEPPPLIYTHRMTQWLHILGQRVCTKSSSKAFHNPYLMPSAVIIQNTTFGGIQGFTQKPSTPWYGDDGSMAGIIHQVRMGRSH